MKVKSKRFLAGVMSGVMALGLVVSNIAPTLAQDTEAYGYDYIASPAAYANVIAQATNRDGSAITGSYVYFDDETYFEAGELVEGKVFSALRYGDDFFGDLGEDVNVFFNLNGQYHRWAGEYICGGEALNPATDGQPAILAKLGSATWPLAGPYTAGSTTFYYIDGTYDAAAAAKQGVVGDGLLQGPETKQLTDMSVIYDASKGTVTPTDKHLMPGDEPVIGPVPDQDDDGEMDYLKPTDTDNVYEVVDKDGTSKQPPVYVYDKNTDGDGDPTTRPGNLTPADKVDSGTSTTPNGFYVEDPENIWHKVQPDGTLDADDGVWGGEDGNVTTTGDNKPVHNYDTDGNGTLDTWYADNGDNTFVPVTGTTQDTANIVGGGGDKNPSTYPVKPIYTDPDTGKHYVGPLDTDGDGKADAFYGDATSGGNGLVDSTADTLAPTDEKFFIDPTTGKPTTTDPATIVTGVALDASSATLKTGDTKTLTATVSPSTALAGKTVTWTSSDPSVATVDANGKVTAIGAGTATITASVGGKKAECAITVTSKPLLDDKEVALPGDIDLPEVTGDTPVSVWSYNLTFEADGYAWRLVGMDKDGNFLITTIDLPRGGEFTMQVDENGDPYTAKQNYYALSHYDKSTKEYRDNKSTFGTTSSYDSSQALYSAMTAIYEDDLTTMKSAKIIKRTSLSGITAATWNTGYSSVVTNGGVRIFPLSLAEAWKLMTVNGGQTTDGTRIGSYSNGTASPTWLRSPSGNIAGHACTIWSDGDVGNGYYGYYVSTSYGVRPALWVNFG